MSAFGDSELQTTLPPAPPAPGAAEPTVPAGPRKGGALFRATSPFAEDDVARSYRLLFVSLGAWAAVVAVAAFAPWWPIRLAAAVLTALLHVRLFIFVHDEAHGAIFRNPGLGRAMCRAISVYLLAPPSVWRETHDYHHRNNAKMVGASIGSYPVITTRVWAILKPKDRRRYTIARHPLTIALGYLTIFAIGMCLSPFRRDPKAHWGAPLALLFHVALLAVVSVFAGLDVALFAIVIPTAIASATGSYLFYAQHNFPDIDLKDRKEWDYTYAALRSSSMFDMTAPMHWLTGNIGFHHVHHLNHRIPFYRLPDAMSAIPELQDPGRTSWRPSDVFACLRLKLWDPGQGRMVGWPEGPGQTDPQDAAGAEPA